MEFMKIERKGEEGGDRDNERKSRTKSEGMK
jgi:hypothetical protein